MCCRCVRIAQHLIKFTIDFVEVQFGILGAAKLLTRNVKDVAGQFFCGNVVAKNVRKCSVPYHIPEVGGQTTAISVMFVCEEQPVSPLDVLKLFSDDASKGGTDNPSFD